MPLPSHSFARRFAFSCAAAYREAATFALWLHEVVSLAINAPYPHNARARPRIFRERFQRALLIIMSPSIRIFVQHLRTSAEKKFSNVFLVIHIFPD
jgi:hypothetical protein